MNRPPIPDDLINISDEEFKKWLDKDIKFRF